MDRGMHRRGNLIHGHLSMEMQIGGQYIFSPLFCDKMITNGGILEF